MQVVEVPHPHGRGKLTNTETYTGDKKHREWEANGKTGVLVKTIKYL